MKRININDTREYHRNEIDSLSWEVTVCNTLEEKNSLPRSILKKQGTFGNLLLDHIDRNYPQHRIKNVLEVGGGYGYLMRDILFRIPGVRAVMLDISPFLLNKQRETLKKYNCEFIEQDLFETGNDFLSQFDTVFLNENAGDFETVSGLFPNEEMNREGNRSAKRALDIIERYGKKWYGDHEIILNTGAIEAVEKFCGAGPGFIYLSEHSSESRAPGELEELLGVTPSDNPEPIKLKGHTEYTIRFSDLVIVAEKYNYKVERGSFADIIRPDLSNELLTLLRSGISSDRNEIIEHFVYDLYKYEYLILTK